MDSPVIDLAKQLISRPSITPDDAGCQLLISERLTRAGFTCESLRFTDVDNLFARYGSKGPLLLFAGHTDVVPTGPEQDWRSPPFTPTLRDGHLYGRGASDMKGAVAAMVIAAENFVKQHPQLTGSIGFLITSDEEGPSINGTKKALATLLDRGLNIDYCLIGEPSSIKQVGDQIRVGRRGSLHGKLTIHGKQGHVAHPHLAINPIHSSSLALHELAQTTWDHGNEQFPPTSFQISNVHSGTGAANVIPGHLESTFNFRYGTAVTMAELQQRTEATLQKHALNYDIEWTVGALPFLTQHGRLITATQEAIKALTGHTVALSTGGGTSDGRFIAPTGAEVVELGVSHATAHHVNESASVSDLEMLVKIYERILAILFT